MKKKLSLAAMLIAIVFWGVAFSAQSSGMKYVGPMLFVMLRSIVGVVSLILVIVFIDLWRHKKISFWGVGATKLEKRKLCLGGLWCGLIIAGASSFQQLGLLNVSAGKTGFLTALYIIIVPLLGIFFKRKTSLLLYVAIVIALTGAYLLCGGVDNFGIGELCVVICAGLFAVHILVIDRYAPECDCVRLSCGQFIVASVAAGAASLLFREPWVWQEIVKSLPFWVFCGVGSSCIAFTLQMFAQKYLHPASVALLMSLESVFAVLGGWIFLQEVLSLRELAGCAVILIAVIMAQLPELCKRKTVNAETEKV